MLLRSEPDAAVKLKESEALYKTPTDEELVEMQREALHEANTGQTRPVEELLLELDEILAEHDAAD